MGMLGGFGLILLIATLAVALLILRALSNKPENSHITDETRMVQEMYRTLGRLEERIEVLETLMDDKRPR